MFRGIMRKLFFVACIFCFSIAGFSTPELAQSGPSKPLSPLEQSLIASTRAIPEAQKTRNVELLKRTLTDDFVGVGSEGNCTTKKRF